MGQVREGHTRGSRQVREDEAGEGGGGRVVHKQRAGGQAVSGLPRGLVLKPSGLRGVRVVS